MGDRFKILIIGIESFTGIHLAKYFSDKKFEVYGTDLYPKEESVLKVDILKQDEILVAVETVKPDYIINLAAISFVGESNRSLIYEVNVLGTENILDAILKSKVHPQKVLIPSSAVVYGLQGTQVLHEDLIPNPINHYGYAKYASEQICRTYYDKLNIIVTRPFNYTGPGQNESFLIPKLIKAFQCQQKEIALGNLNTYREYNDVRFVCEAYHRLLISKAKSEVTNVCTGTTHSVNDLLSILSEMSKVRMKVRVDERFIRSNEIMELKGETSKLNNLIGEISQSYSIKDTLLSMYQSA